MNEVQALWRSGPMPRRYREAANIENRGVGGAVAARTKVRPGESANMAIFRVLQILVNAYRIERKQDMISIVPDDGNPQSRQSRMLHWDALFRAIKGNNVVPVEMSPPHHDVIPMPTAQPPCPEVVTYMGWYSRVWGIAEMETGKSELSGKDPIGGRSKQELLENWAQIPVTEYFLQETHTRIDLLNARIARENTERTDQRPLLPQRTDAELIRACRPKVPTLRCLVARALLKDLEKPYDCINPTPPLLQRPPIWYTNNGFVSGGNPEGVLKVLQATVRERMKPKIPAKFVVTAVLDYLLEFGAPDANLEPAPVDETSAAISGCDPNKAAGYVPCKEGREEFEDQIVEFSWTASKGMAKHVVYAQMQTLAIRIRDHLKGSATGRISEQFWPNLFAKIAIKSEVRSPETDRTKVRAFFVVAMLRGVVDKLIYEPAFKATYDRGPMGIGFQKDQGGMEEMFDFLHGREKGWFYIETDFSKYDQSMMASLLVIVFMIPLWFYSNRTASERVSRYNILRESMVWAADSIACSLVKWSGLDVRLIIGVMFSGLFGTSWGGTTYAVIMRKCFNYWMYERLQSKDMDLAERWRQMNQPYKQYGDDKIMAFLVEFYEAVVGEPIEKWDRSTKPRVLMEFYQEAFGVALKPEETHVYVGRPVVMNGREIYHYPLLTLVEEDVLLLHYTATADEPVGEGYVRIVSPDLAHLGRRRWTRHRIVHEGPKFLQRRWVVVNIEGKRRITYWRKTEDYYTRATLTASDNATMQSYPEMRLAMFILKLRGMAYDVGANIEAYNMLEFLHDNIVHHNPQALMKLPEWKKLIERSFEDVFIPSSPEETAFLSAMRDVVDKLASHGQWRFANLFDEFPDYVDIRDHLLDDEYGNTTLDRVEARARVEQYWEIWRRPHPFTGKTIALPSEYDRYLARYH